MNIDTINVKVNNPWQIVINYQKSLSETMKKNKIKKLLKYQLSISKI